MSKPLTKLKERFPKAKFTHEPTAGCARCGGTGVKPPRVLRSTGRPIGEGPCPCLFFGPNTELAMGLLQKTARRLRDE